MKYDKTNIELWWNTFAIPNGGTEIRAIGDKVNYSIYLKTEDSDVLEKTLSYIIDTLQMPNVYFVLNQINKACFSRDQHRCLVKNAKTTTSDNDIVRRKWIFIDFDPVRPAGTSSSEVEISLAKAKANTVREWLTLQGFHSMVTAMSGNGCHILIPVDLPTNRETTKQVEYFLKTLALMYSDDKVEIDKKVFNLSRICKLYGTYAKKGQDTQERPHRLSQLGTIPQQMRPNDYQLIQRLASVSAMAEKPQSTMGYRGTKAPFDLRTWLTEHGLSYTESSGGQNTKFYTGECPFNSAHKGKDSFIWQSADGAIGFHCSHNSCEGKGWRDFRLHYEPDAYSHGYELPSQQRLSQRQRRIQNLASATQGSGTSGTTPEPSSGTSPVWYKPSTIPLNEYHEEDYIKSGYRVGIDNRIKGFRRGHVSVWSGTRGCGKTSVLNMLTLNAINEGYRVALWSGELNANDIMQWLYLQAAGDFTLRTSHADFFFVPQGVMKRITKWLDDRLLIFNNDYGSKYELIAEKIDELFEGDGNSIDMLILDNLMALDIQGISVDDQYTDQKALMQRLHVLADVRNIHIHIVCHPNKQMGYIRPNHISGSGNIADLAQNIFIMHRVNKDFEKSLGDFDKQKKEDIIATGATNVIEICKCRDKGTAVDKFVHLKFIPECNQLVEISEGGGWKVREYDWNKQELTTQPRQESIFDNHSSQAPYRQDQDDDPGNYADGTIALENKPADPDEGCVKNADGTWTWKDGNVRDFPPSQTDEHNKAPF